MSAQVEEALIGLAMIEDRIDAANAAYKAGDCQAAITHVIEIARDYEAELLLRIVAADGPQVGALEEVRRS